MAIKGKDLIFSLSVNGISTPFLYCKTCTLTQTADVLETTTQGSGSARSYEYYKTGYKLSLTSLTELLDSTYSSLFLQNCLNGRVKVDWSFQLDLTTYYSGKILVTSAQIDAAFDGVSNFTGELLGDGDLTITATVPPISGGFNYIRVFYGDPGLSVNGLGQQVYTDQRLKGHTGYPIQANQLSNYFTLAEISYDPVAGSFTILQDGFLLVSGYDLVIYPYQVQLT